VPVRKTIHYEENPLEQTWFRLPESGCGAENRDGMSAKGHERPKILSRLVRTSPQLRTYSRG
jgi:hypothetical protein